MPTRTNNEKSEEEPPEWKDTALEFAEKMGRLVEERGQPRMLGRVIGWLVVCEPPYQSTAELAKALHASTSAVNSMIHNLQLAGIVDKITFPGMRSAYFRIPDDAPTKLFRDGLPNLRAMRELAAEGLELFAWRGLESNRRLRDMFDLHAFFERELPRLIERWEEECERRKE